MEQLISVLGEEPARCVIELIYDILLDNIRISADEGQDDQYFAPDLYTYERLDPHHRDYGFITTINGNVAKIDKPNSYGDYVTVRYVTFDKDFYFV